MLFSFALSACGEKSQNEADDGQLIKLIFIGQIVDTANTTPVPEMLTGVESAIKRVNKNGGVNGKQLKLIICDDKADPNEAAKCARQAVREGVAASVGSNSNFSEAILPVLERGNIASIGQLPITAGDFSARNSFPLQSGSPGMIAGASRQIAEQGTKALRLVAVDSPAGSLNERFASAALAGSDTKILGLTLVPIEAPDYASYVAAAARDADGMVIGMNSDQAGRFLQALHLSGKKIPVALTVGAVPPAMVKRLGPAAEGLLVSAPFRPIETGGKSNAQFQADMKAHAPDGELNVFSQGGWLAAETFVRAMEQQEVTDFSSKSVLSAMSKLEGLDTGDMIPPLTTTKEFAAPYNRLFINKVMFARIRGGKLELVDDAWHDTLFQ
tara:strand:+ start:3096 stop:4250 length:1155 start_codon:yes stop_codon:yes gene_type:complete